MQFYCNLVFPLQPILYMMHMHMHIGRSYVAFCLYVSHPNIGDKDLYCCVHVHSCTLLLKHRYYFVCGQHCDSFSIRIQPLSLCDDCFLTCLKHCCFWEAVGMGGGGLPLGLKRSTAGLHAEHTSYHWANHKQPGSKEQEGKGSVLHSQDGNR